MGINSLFEGNFGLERETLRVNSSGNLSPAPHPFTNDTYFERDFCENQLEIITPVCPDINALLSELYKLDMTAKKLLFKQGEYLWMYSNPPHIESEDDIPVAMYKGDKAFKRDYRLKLEERYGKRLMLYSGIHFNFSFSESLLKSMYTGSGGYGKFKNDLYFRLSKQIFRYSWLLVLLTAASPVYDLSLCRDAIKQSAFDGYGSMRSSVKGYWNKFIPILDYTDLNSYVKSVQRYIDTGALISTGELYLPVRLKPNGQNDLNSLISHGVNHIELRMFDVNPLSPVGIFREDIEFTHYFLLYLLNLPDFEFTEKLQKISVKNYREAAKYSLTDMTINGYSAKSAAYGLLDDMREYFKSYPFVLKSIAYQKKKLQKGMRYCEKIYDTLIGDYHNSMLKIARHGSDFITQCADTNSDFLLCYF